jgi:hypothetical protein
LLFCLYEEPATATQAASQRMIKKRVLICYDGSEDSKRAIDYVCEFGRKEHEFVLFGAYERLHYPRPLSYVGSPSEFNSSKAPLRPRCGHIDFTSIQST